MDKKTVFISGGAGYIGSHAVLVFLQAGHDVVVLDNLSNGSAQSLERVSEVVGRPPVFVKGDVRDSDVLKWVFKKHEVNAVLHFAGLKSVAESISCPMHYYDNNILGTLILCKEMQRAKINTLVFSSSATVYGANNAMPIKEDCGVYEPINPYGRSKYFGEKILEDIHLSDSSWKIAILRYFNPVGAHESGLIGESPQGIPNNLMPYISQVAAGRLDKLSIFGDDYPTPDGTGIRDYIHVMDLVEGHLKALEAIESIGGSNIWNLGTGHGYSVLEVLKAFEEVSGKKIAHEFVRRRAGDIPVCYADVSKAERELGWRAARGLREMVKDAWRWQQMNPEGF